MAGAGGIYMALYKVAIEAGGGEEAALQIYGGAHLPLAKGGFVEGFLHGGYLVAAAFDGFHGKANPVMRHALVHFQISGKGAFNPKSTVGALGSNPCYLAQHLDDSGKHAAKIGILDFLLFVIPNSLYLCRS